MLRRFTFALALLVPGAAYAAEGDACDPAAFENSCNGDEITLCGAAAEGDPNTELVFNCSNEFYVGGDGNPIDEPTISCVVPTCTGTCADNAQCWGEAAGGVCQGFLGIAAVGQDALVIGCGPGFTCGLGAQNEECVAAETDCAAGDEAVSCQGDTLTFCAGDEESTFTDPLAALDCVGLGGTCKTDGEFTGCFGGEGALCSPLGFVAVCDEGFECAADAGAQFGACAAAEGEGEGEGEEGEGEGEGGECEDDSDCGDGETCEDGECIAPPPTCATPGSMKVPFAGLALITVLVPLFRRRRAA